MWVLLLSLGIAAIPAGDAQKGKVLFTARCAVCHSADSSNKQGPGLGGVVGRGAASADFSFSAALKASHLTWNPGSLDRFLTSPTRLVPGTTMPQAVPRAADRRNLIAFLSTLAPSAAPAPPPPPAAAGEPAGAGPRVGAVAYGSFSDDAPGVRRRFTVESLPAPYATRSANRGPRVIPQPEGASLAVPAGYAVDLYAEGLPGARLLRVAPNGDVFVAQSSAHQISVLRPTPSGAPEKAQLFAGGLDQPFGMAFYPRGPRPAWLYVALNSSVVRFPYQDGDRVARGPPEVVVARLCPAPRGGHWTRDLTFSADGRRMFVSVGSASNVAEEIPAEPPGGLDAWTRGHALGAVWGEEEDRADVLAFDPEGKSREVFATGLRNCVGVAVEPTTGELWCSVNERDGLGDDLVPDYLTRVRQGAFYGWPWFYIGGHPDGRIDPRPDLAERVTVPDVLVQPHSAALQLAFYTGTQFPHELVGDAFVAFHGSWNRSWRTGYKIERVRLRGGVPTGEVEDFVTGFAVSNDSVWGRPVGVAVAADGSLLFSEDGHGTIWRVRSTTAPLPAPR